MITITYTGVLNNTCEIWVDFFSYLCWRKVLPNVFYIFISIWRGVFHDIDYIFITYKWHNIK